VLASRKEEVLAKEASSTKKKGWGIKKMEISSIWNPERVKKK